MFELKNMSNIFCGPAQDRPLRSADLVNTRLTLRNKGMLILFSLLSKFRKTLRTADVAGK